MKLRTYLSLVFGLVALLTVGSLSLAASRLMVVQFHRYVSDLQEQSNRNLIRSIGRGYEENRNNWNGDWLEPICVDALDQGQILTVRTENQTIVWDAHTHDSEQCKRIMETMEQNAIQLYPRSEGSYIVKDYPLIIGNDVAATVSIGSYEPYLLTQQDVAFLESLNRLFLLAAVLSMAISVAAGIWLASRLSKPVVAATQSANQIAAGNRNVFMNESSSLSELSGLAGAVNNLSDALTEQELLRTRLTRDVAHELRTPITTLQAQIEAMQDGVWPADAARLDSLQEEISRLGRLVEDLTNLSQYDQESLQLNRRPTDLAALAARAADRFQGRFRSKQIELQRSLKPVEALVDPDRISQVLLNLLENSLRNTSRGHVYISTGLKDGQAFLTVADTGTGIPKEHISHIFERFYRVDDARRRDKGGSGIGLSIVRSIVVAHGGSIQVESEPERGSRFTVLLPLDESADPVTVNGTHVIP